MIDILTNYIKNVFFCHLNVCPSAPEYVQSRRAPDSTWGAVYPPQRGCDCPPALCSHKSGMHVGQAGDQTIWSTALTARGQIHCEDVTVVLINLFLLFSLCIFYQRFPSLTLSLPYCGFCY